MANAFQLLLSRNLEWRADVEGLPFVVLTPVEAGNLEVPFSEEEVLATLKELYRDKTTMILLWVFGRTRHLVEGEILETVQRNLCQWNVHKRS